MKVAHDPLKRQQPIGISSPFVGTQESILAPAFRTQNDMFALADLLTREEQKFDPNFNVSFYMDRDPLAELYPERLVNARNLTEYKLIQERIKQEELDRLRLGANPVAGFFAQAAAGLISPTTLIPGLGMARGLKGAAQASALAAAAVAPQELVLGAAQETRTGQEMAINVGATAVFGALLGGLARGMPAKDAKPFVDGYQPGRISIESRGPEGSYDSIKLDTIEFNNLPRLDEVQGVITGNKYTVFGVQGTPMQAVARSDGFLDVDGRPVKVGEEFHILPPQSPAFRVGGVEVSTYSMEELKQLRADRVEQLIFSTLSKERDQATYAEHMAVLFEMERRGVQNLSELDGLPRFNELAKNFVEEEKILDYPTPSTVGAQARDIDPGRLQRSDTKLGRAQRKARKAIEESNFGGTGKLGAILRGTASRLIAPDVIGVLAKLNPVTRLMDGEFVLGRRAASMLQNPGVKLDGDDIVAPDGEVVSRALVHHAHVADWVQKFDEHYAKYVYGKEAVGWGDKAISQLRSGLRQVPEGKMTYREFSTATFDGVHTGIDDAMPSELKDAIEDTNSFFNTMVGIADEYFLYRTQVDPEKARPLFEKYDGNEIHGLDYIKHMFDTNEMVSRSDEFINDIANNFIRRMEKSLDKSIARYRKVLGKLDAEEALLRADPEELANIYQSNLDLLASIKADPIYKAGVEGKAALRKSMKEAGETPEDIKAAVAEYEATMLSEEFKAQDIIYKEAARIRRMLSKMNADSEARVTKLEAKIKKEETTQLNRLQTLINKAEVQKRKLEKLSDEAYKAKEDKAMAGVEKARKSAETHLARLEKYLENADSRTVAQAGRAKKAADRLESALNKRLQVKQFDRQAAIKELENVIEAAKQRTQRLNAKNAVRAEKAAEELKDLDPEKLAKSKADRLEVLAEQKKNLKESLETLWSSRGARELDLDKGTANFSRRAQEIGEDLYRKITGSPNRVMGIELLTEERGSELARTLNLPYNVKRKWLIRDTERVIRSYAHSMFPDMEMYRATGSVNGSPLFDELEIEVREKRRELAEKTYASPEAKAKALTAYDDRAKQAEEDLFVLIERLRNQRGMPGNPNGIAYRIGRLAQNANVYRFMGMVVPSSLPDLARPMFYYGMAKTMKQAWLPYITNSKKIKITREQARRLGVALDTVLHNRFHAIFDIGENYSTRQTYPEKAVEFLANKTGLMAMFDKWTVENKILAATMNITEFTHAARVLAGETKATKQELNEAYDMFKNAGIGTNWAYSFVDQMKRKGGSNVVDEVHLPNVGSWADAEAVRVFGAAIQKLTDDMIITPGLDRPSWVDANTPARLIAQFRSFNFTATNRIMLATLQDPNMKAMQGVTMALGLGAMSYYIWAVAKGGDAYETAMNGDMQHWVYEAVGRSGLLGILAEGQRLGEQVPWLNDWVIFGGEERPTRRANSVMGQFFGPSYDLAERLIRVTQDISDPTESTIHNARVALVPYQNAHLFARGFDQLEKILIDLGDIPERRGE